MMRRLIPCCALVLALVGCAYPGGPDDIRRVETFKDVLDDPTKCACDQGLRSFVIRPSGPGRLDAAATVEPGGAHVFIRLLDNDLNSVYAVSTQQDGTARLDYDVAPVPYVVQVFLGVDGPRQATFTLNVVYP